ncbi:MAG: rhodanese-like domain-containing protein [Steroidobacteraceae bacterium]|jgi:rhodanese-related sulfurtransferase|nr:rhodanese-like domain-containing protein [Steroidobacteraceae bacterium]
MMKRLLALCAALAVLPALAEAPAVPLEPVAPAALEQRLGEADLVVLDVRSAEEFAAGHVPGAINVPYDQVAGRLAELAGAKDKDVVLYCRSGRRVEVAAGVLAKNGFTRLSHLEGDFPAWSKAGLPTQATAPAAPATAVAAP